MEECPSDKYQQIPGNLCTDSCDNYTDATNNYCLADCLENPNQTNIYRENNTCVPECSKFTNPTGKKVCVVELYVIETSKTTGLITLEYEQTLLWVDNYVTSYKELHLHIQGEDFNLQVYSTKEPLTENLEMTSFNLDECIKKIRKKENIPDDEELIIAKYDLYDNGHTTNQIRYKVYTKKGIELSLEVCEGIKILDDIMQFIKQL